MQVPNSAYLRSDAAGVCHVQPVVPCRLRFPLQGPPPKGGCSPPYPSCFQRPATHRSCKSVACHLHEGYSCTSAVREALQQSAPMHAPVHALRKSGCAGITTSGLGSQRMHCLCSTTHVLHLISAPPASLALPPPPPNAHPVSPSSCHPDVCFADQTTTADSANF